MFLTIDLNADLGEGFGESRASDDEELLGVVSSANIACGFHAGDAVSMHRTVRAAKEHGVTVGAHPSYPDIPGFGRRELGLPAREIQHHVAYQLESIAAICDAEGARLAYVKPHGALYNRAAWDPKAAEAIVAALRTTGRDLTLLGLPASEASHAAERAAIRFVNEAFVDRQYTANGTLIPRTEPEAVIRDVAAAVKRAVRLVREGTLTTMDGTTLHIDAQSLCVHGDNPAAAPMIRRLREQLEKSGVRIAPFAA